MPYSNFTTAISGLIEEVSCRIPPDVVAALERARKSERRGSTAYVQLGNILENIRIAASERRPVCQDTGMLTFIVEAPPRADRRMMRRAIESAVASATRQGFLRPNAVCPLTGRNTGNNIGTSFPAISWSTSRNDGKALVYLMMKGGGSENVGRQYALPCMELGAERSMEGVRKCVVDAVIKAQGLGCPPGIISVCVGGDRAAGFAEAKKNFLRKIGERCKDRKAADLEKRLLEDINRLGIGPAGLGGKTTALDVFVSLLSRHPACFFVTVSYMCWACRRGSAAIAL